MPPYISIPLILFAVFAVLFILYLFAVRPLRRAHTAQYMRTPYAHRGLHDADLPENSMAAFRAACRAGYGIELDVQLSSDGEVVVFHDATLDRVCGISGKVIERTAEELGRLPLCGKAEHTIPTFADVLNAVGGRVPLMVEIKGTSKENTYAVCEAVAPMLDAYEGAYCIESFNPYAVYWFQKNRPEVVRGQLSSRFWKDPKHRNAQGLLMQSLVTNFITKPDFISFDRRYNRFFPFVVARGLWHGYASAWTVKSRAQEIAACRDSFDCVIFEGYLPDGKDATK
ncbi:MAG: glycerophosphodiester phosphodiesterase [Clostridia bacterium]|nr:glycerophosphodiester phosphodiesterase [Clostridia bacterium]